MVFLEQHFILIGKEGTRDKGSSSWRGRRQGWLLRLREWSIWAWFLTVLTNTSRSTASVQHYTAVAALDGG